MAKQQAVVYLDDLIANGKSIIYFRSNPNPNFAHKAVVMSSNANKTIKDLLSLLKAEFPTIESRVEFTSETDMGTVGQWVIIPEKADLTTGFYSKAIKF